jgi:hypothetical protein
VREIGINSSQSLCNLKTRPARFYFDRKPLLSLFA